ncbi:MAG TPA: hypothetical protein VN516_06510, partial [Candidatus Baltobacteraceae bacterium]|nr:hypothetical protein [Candidatus Baltobacteraceae bacterium]
MLELKVECDCGQRYKFDVEPANGRMPFVINCPACGVDGTEKANVLIQQSGYVGESLPVAQLAPIPAASTPPPLGQTRLRVNATAHAAPASTPPPIGSIATPPARRPFPGLGQPATAPTETSGKKPNFWLGMVGGFLGVFLGGLIYYLVFKYSGHRIGLLGIGV